jgi:hypothetical protein
MAVKWLSEAEDHDYRATTGAFECVVEASRWIEAT